jgi:glutamine synthetase
MTYEKILEICKKSKIEIIDFKFCDLPGTWQHFGIPLKQFDKSIFTEGTGFDGSSIRGFKEIEESDMILIPDISTFSIDPFGKIPGGSFLCNVYESAKKRFPGDPRFIAEKAEKYLIESGIADKSCFGPEAEFFIFDSVKFGEDQNLSYHEIKSAEANWHDCEKEGIADNGNKIRNKEGYFPTAPLDQLVGIRREMVIELEKAGIEVEKEHHEVSTGGQAEIDIKYDSLLNAADKLMAFKYIVKNVAARNGKTATFMPKPIFGDNGSGMHIHISLWKKGNPVFYEKSGYADLSETALHFTGGLLKHAPALMAFAAPTTNSYKRLVPGYEAPVNLAYSASNRSAAIRIPAYSDKPHAKRIEFRPPDPSANPYLIFSAMLMAGLDGIKNKINPGKPFDKNIYKLSEKDAAEIPKVPDSLDKSLLALEKDNKFLTAGGVFSDSLIKTWIDYKKKSEYDFIRIRPTAAEFILYYNA